MMVPYILLGFLIGQIVTVEGIRGDRLLYSLLSLLFAVLFVLLPTFAMVAVIQFLHLEKSPFALAGSCILFGYGLVTFLEKVCDGMRHTIA